MKNMYQVHKSQRCNSITTLNKFMLQCFFLQTHPNLCYVKLHAKNPSSICTHRFVSVSKTVSQHNNWYSHCYHFHYTGYLTIFSTLLCKNNKIIKSWIMGEPSILIIDTWVYEELKSTLACPSEACILLLKLQCPSLCIALYKWCQRSWDVFWSPVVCTIIWPSFI